MVSPPRFITFEGIDGTGKSLQVERLAARLRAAGADPVLTREPGGTGLGVGLRALLLEPSESPMSPATELLLYLADRAQHLHEVVIPSLDRGRIVLCDRYLDATVAYQGHARDLGAENIVELHRQLGIDRRPDRTVLLDLDPDDALARARSRDSDSGTAAREGRFEAETRAFHTRVREGYLAVAAGDPERVRIVDARGTPDEVEIAVGQALADLLPELEAVR